MRNFFAWLIIAFSSAALAQTYTTVTATGIVVDNGSGSPVNPPSGSNLCFLGVNNLGAAVTYTPAGGSPVTGTVCQTLDGSGNLTGSMQVANPATASPIGLLYTITISNGSTTYITIPTAQLLGSIFALNAYSLPVNGHALGIGSPHLSCAAGATWTSTTYPSGQDSFTCNLVSGVGTWQTYPKGGSYCPAGMGYLTPQITGTPFCLPPILAANGAPSGSCIKNSTYYQQDDPGVVYGCVNSAWVAIAGGGVSGITSFQGRSSPTATLQSSDVSGILSNSPFSFSGTRGLAFDNSTGSPSPSTTWFMGSGNTLDGYSNFNVYNGSTSMAQIVQATGAATFAQGAFSIGSSGSLAFGGGGSLASSNVICQTNGTNCPAGVTPLYQTMQSSATSLTPRAKLNFLNASGFSLADNSGNGSTDVSLSSVPNSALSNSSITINVTGSATGGGTIPLGGSTTINVTGGVSAAPPSFALQFANSGASALSGDSTLTFDSVNKILNTENFNVSSTVTQNCPNPIIQVPASTLFTCQFFAGTNSAIPSGVGQGASGSMMLNGTYNITSPGSNPGTNGAINDFQETTGGGPVSTSNIFQRGNHTGGASVINCYGIGDCQGLNIQALSPSSSTQGADEGNEGARIQVSQLNATTRGTITSGGTTGSTDLQTSVTFGDSFNYTDQGYLFDRSQPTGTGVITGQTYNAGLNIVVQTVSGISLTPSTAWGQMQQSTVTYAPVGGQPVGLYQQYTSTTAVIVLGTSPASPGIFTTGAMTCSGIASEYMQVTAVSAINVPASGEQTITFLTRNGWDNTNSGATDNAACFQGGSLTSQAFLASSSLDQFTIAYPVVGVVSATEFAASNCNNGNCNQLNNLLDVNTPITFFPMAEVIGTDLGTSGAAQLGYNNAPWTNGDTVISALPEATEVTGVHVNISNSTPRAQRTVNTLIQNQGLGVGVFDTGPQPTDMYFYGEAHQDPTNNSYALLGSQGSFQNGLIMYDAPPSGGCLFCTVFALPEGSAFTASASGNQLTVTALASGALLPSQDVIGAGIPTGCLIQSYTPGSGTRGGVGTYTLTCGVSTIASESMTTARGQYFITASLGNLGPDWSYDVTTQQSVMSIAGGAGSLFLNANVSAPSFADTSLTSGSCVQGGTGGLLTTTGSPCGPTFGTPASSSAACTVPQVEYDGSFIYTCVATNTWTRAATLTW